MLNSFEDKLKFLLENDGTEYADDVRRLSDLCQTNYVLSDNFQEQMEKELRSLVNDYIDNLSEDEIKNILDPKQSMHNFLQSLSEDQLEELKSFMGAEI